MMEKKMFMVTVYSTHSVKCVVRCVVLAEDESNAWDVFCEHMMKEHKTDFKHGDYYFNAYDVGNACVLNQR